MDVTAMTARMVDVLAARPRLRFALGRDPGPDGEVDVLVHPDDLGAARTALEGAGYRHVPSWGRGSHLFLRGYDASRDAWLLVDTVTSLDFGPHQEFRTDALPALLDRADGVAGHRLHPADELWALVGHVLLDKGGRLGRHGPRLRELATTTSRVDLLAGPLATGPFAVLGDDRTDHRAAVLDALATLDPSAEGTRDTPVLAAAAGRLRAAWTTSSSSRRGLRHRMLLKATRLVVPLRRPGGTVAVLADDPATADRAARAVAGRWPLQVAVVPDGATSAAGRLRAVLRAGNGATVLVPATVAPSGRAAVRVQDAALGEDEVRRLVGESWRLAAARWSPHLS